MPFRMRENIQMRLNKRIEDIEHGYRQNVGIIGPLGVGKTKLLSEFFQSLSRNPKLIPVYIHAETIDADQLIEQWMGAMLSSVLLDRTLNIPKTLDALIREAEPFIPQTLLAIQQLKKLMRQEKNILLVKELFALTGKLAHELKRKVILIIDEFQALEKLPVPDPFALLGKQMMVDKETLYLVSSSATDRAREIFRDKLSLLFGNFEILELVPFGFMEMEQYLASRLPAHRWSYPLKKFLFRMTDGEPLYLDLFMNRLENYELHEVPQNVSPSVLLDVFCQELFDRRGRIALIFERRIEQCGRMARHSGPYIRTMLALSYGCRKIVNIAAFIKEPIAEAKKILKRLTQEGLIVKSGSFYHIPDVLFRFWLREVFQKRHSLFLPEERLLWKQLFDALNRILEAAMDPMDDQIQSRLERLLKEFRNDTVEIDQKKKQCPHFSEIIGKPSHDAVQTFLARSNRGKWFLQATADWVGEEAIASFLAESKHVRKLQKRILMPLLGIDQNARLMAQEAKIEMLDLRQLNILLDLYDLPKIIILPKKGSYEPKESYGSDVVTMAQNLSTRQSA